MYMMDGTFCSYPCPGGKFRKLKKCGFVYNDRVNKRNVICFEQNVRLAMLKTYGFVDNP